MNKIYKKYTLLTDFSLVASFVIAAFLAFPLSSPTAENNNFSINEKECSVLTTSHSSYSKSIKKLLNLRKVKEWQSSLDQGAHSSYLPATSKTEFLNGGCFWSVGLYESRKDQLLLWKIFLIEINGKRIYYLSDIDGSYKAF